jgi:hypothetical protein
VPSRAGPSPSKSSWKFVGLNNIVVNRLNLFNRTIYAATQDGMYIYKNGHFKRAGLKGKNVIDMIHIGKDTMLAGLGDYHQNAITLFRTTDDGASWKPHMGNYGGKEGNTVVNALAINPDNKNILFARGRVNVSRSFDGGQTWKSVMFVWDGIGDGASMLKIDPYNPAVIWAGGAAATKQAMLTKSINNGDNWLHLQRKINVVGEVTSIAIHPFNDKIVLVGLESPFLPGSIVCKSIDGGQTWHTVLDSTYTLTLARSARDPMTIYASGAKPDPSQLFFSVSPDFGETWKMVIWKDSPSTPIHANDMVSVMQNGHEVLYFGTNKGIYSYTFAK